MLRELDRKLDIVLEFQLRDRETLDRAPVEARAVEEDRSDDTPEAIAQAARAVPPSRPSRSSSSTARARNVVAVHAERPIDEVFGEIQEALEQAAVA